MRPSIMLPALAHGFVLRGRGFEALRFPAGVEIG